MLLQLTSSVFFLHWTKLLSFLHLCRPRLIWMFHLFSLSFYATCKRNAWFWCHSKGNARLWLHYFCHVRSSVTSDNVCHLIFCNPFLSSSRSSFLITIPEIFNKSSDKRLQESKQQERKDEKKTTLHVRHLRKLNHASYNFIISLKGASLYYYYITYLSQWKVLTSPYRVHESRISRL